jgi:hypothetical protein
MFIVVSYLSDGCNYCMGCKMESWGSDLVFDEFETKEQAAEFVAAEETRQEKKCGPGEPLHREYVIIEGKLLIGRLESAKRALDILLEDSII